jgi:preprotein translocase subunit SecD
LPPNKGSAATGDRPRKKIQRKRLPVAPYFLALTAVVAVLWIGAVAGAGFKFPTPKLGLDLQGGLSMTLTAYQQGSTSAPDEDTMEQARQIIENRVNATGVSEPEVYVEGRENIVVNVAGADTDEEALRAVGAPAELRFRIVTAELPDYSGLTESQLDDVEEPAEDAEANGDGTEDATEDGEESPEAEDTGEGGSAEDDADDAAGSPQVDTDDGALTVDDVWTKVGDEAAELAQSLTTTPADEASMIALEPFGELNGEEVSLLPSNVQFYVPAITCRQLDSRPPGSVQEADAEVVACSEPVPVTDEEDAPTYQTKYLLQPASVLGSDVTSADVGNDPANLNLFVVNIEFSAEGARKWGSLTTSNIGNQVAIVLDNRVVSDPVIREASSTRTQISGDFTSSEARLLSDQLNFGSLPTHFVVETVNEVTATLGVEQLEAALLAGALGLALVFLYCLAYYRVLGVIVLGSLGTAAIVLYGTVSLLGSQIGLTLTLAGMAGFVVSIGITADSFVVYFERVKEEMRDGRSARTAVPRAWERTRRTILSANAVSIISALVLYFLAIGPVRAFAFALGLSTVVNILVVFLFTHPIAEFFARGGLLNNPRLSGLHTRLSPAETGTSAATKSSPAQAGKATARS